MWGGAWNIFQQTGIPFDISSLGFKTTHSVSWLRIPRTAHNCIFPTFKLEWIYKGLIIIRIIIAITIAMMPNTLNSFNKQTIDIVMLH